MIVSDYFLGYGDLSYGKWRGVCILELVHSIEVLLLIVFWGGMEISFEVLVCLVVLDNGCSCIVHSK